MKKVINTVLLFLMFCLSYVMVMGSEHGVALDHPGASELASFGRVHDVVDPIPEHPPAIPKPVEHQAVPEHEVVPEDTGLSSLQASSKKDELLIKHKQGRYCVHISGNLCGKRRHLIRIPHLSRFAINNSKHKPIIEWIRSFINNGEKFYPVMG